MEDYLKPSLNSGEFLPLMIEMARLMRPKVYMELGVRKGNTFRALAPFAEYSIAVDKERGRIPELIKAGKLKKAAFFQMSTDEFAHIWAGKAQPIDFLFIDADHEKDQVLRDFDNFSPFLKEDTGLILMHDTLPAKPELVCPEKCGTAWEAAWTIRTAKKYEGFEVLTLPGNWVGLTMVRKSKKQLYWKTE